MDWMQNIRATEKSRVTSAFLFFSAESDVITDSRERPLKRGSSWELQSDP